MESAQADRAPAVLETSFWAAACRAEVAANCLDLFQMIVPRGVEEEIRRREPDDPTREYPYATLFRHLRAQMTDPPLGSPDPLPFFGRGESEAIPLAHHLGIGLLINEYRGAQYALTLGILVVTVPEVIVTLRARRIISRRAANRKLDIIAPITASAIILRARQVVDALGS